MKRAIRRRVEDDEPVDETRARLAAEEDEAAYDAWADREMELQWERDRAGEREEF